MMTKNEALAARTDGLADIYTTANPKIAEQLRKLSADLRKGVPRKTVMRDLRKVRQSVGDPHSTLHKTIGAAFSHFGEE